MDACFALQHPFEEHRAHEVTVVFVAIQIETAAAVHHIEGGKEIAVQRHVPAPAFDLAGAEKLFPVFVSGGKRAQNPDEKGQDASAQKIGPPGLGVGEDVVAAALLGFLLHNREGGITARKQDL